MTHDTGYPKEKVEEREHGVFVPPDEQHVREDGTPAEPAESARVAEHISGSNDADRVEAIGTEADPRAPENRHNGTGESRDAAPTLVDPQPASPLDTGTAEDAERAEDMERADAERADGLDRTGGLDAVRERDSDERPGDIAAEDETRTVDARTVDTDDVDARTVNTDNVDTRTVDVDAIDVEAVNVDNRLDSDRMADDRLDSDQLDSDRMDGDTVDSDIAGADRVDPDEVAVGTASVPEQSTASSTDFWPTGLVDDLRGRWDAVQLRFVDDPSGVADDAKALVGEAVAAVRDAIDRLEARLSEAASEATDETEQLRQRVAHYRDVFEMLLRR